MNKRSLTIGILVTVIWIAIIVFIYLFTGLEHPKSLNEFGDFLAGVFAPVAFFWLILGYMQQGKQLEQNTKALEQQERALQLQIDEMREGIKQQVVRKFCKHTRCNRNVTLDNFYASWLSKGLNDRQ
jgi:hypothetical protein